LCGRWCSARRTGALAIINGRAVERVPRGAPLSAHKTFSLTVDLKSQDGWVLVLERAFIMLENPTSMFHYL